MLLSKCKMHTTLNHGVNRIPERMTKSACRSAAATILQVKSPENKNNTRCQA